MNCKVSFIINLVCIAVLSSITILNRVNVVHTIFRIIIIVGLSLFSYINYKDIIKTKDN
jgi:hypothetical protein